MAGRFGAGLKCAARIAPGPWRAIAAFTALIPLSACRDATQSRIPLHTDALCADVSDPSLSTASPQRVDAADLLPSNTTLRSARRALF